MREIKTINLNNHKKAFPCHFHKFYVIGLIEKGTREMLCNGAQYSLVSGDMVIFNPYDVHSCKSANAMQYRALNIENSLMESIFEGRLPNFQNVIKGLSPDIFKASDDISRARLLKNIPHSFENNNKNLTPEIEKICKIIEQDFSNKISLEFLSDRTGLSKSTILRAFVKQKGITPYRYIENLRINKAKSLLDKGLPLLDAAFEAGFSSQSHFSNSFKTLMGVSPAAYQKGADHV